MVWLADRHPPHIKNSQQQGARARRRACRTAGEVLLSFVLLVMFGLTWTAIDLSKEMKVNQETIVTPNGDLVRVGVSDMVVGPNGELMQRVPDAGDRRLGHGPVISARGGACQVSDQCQTPNPKPKD